MKSLALPICPSFCILTRVIRSRAEQDLGMTFFIKVTTNKSDAYLLKWHEKELSSICKHSKGVLYTNQNFIHKANFAMQIEPWLK